jgi:hypothetical protein
MAFFALHTGAYIDVPTLVNCKYNRYANRTLYPSEWYTRIRALGSSAVQRHIRVKKGSGTLAKVARFAIDKLHLDLSGSSSSGMEGREGGQKVLGVHLRGTDKKWGGSILGPEEYEPLIARYIERYPQTIIFLATDRCVLLLLPPLSLAQMCIASCDL